MKICHFNGGKKNFGTLMFNFGRSDMVEISDPSVLHILAKFDNLIIFVKSIKNDMTIHHKERVKIYYTIEYPHKYSLNIIKSVQRYKIRQP